MIVNSSLYNFPYAGMEGTGVPIRLLFGIFARKAHQIPVQGLFQGKECAV